MPVEEKAFLVEVGSRFAGYIESEQSVSSTSLVRCDIYHYNVDSCFAGKTASVRVYADRVKVFSNGETIADHLRRFERDKTYSEPCDTILRPYAASQVH